jgi:hypothetical protein
MVLARLGQHGIAELAVRARPTLTSLAGDWRAHGLDACPYALALMQNT